MTIYLIIILYVAAALASVAHAIYRSRKLEIAAKALIGASVLLQTIVMFQVYREYGVFPVFSLKYALFMFAWALGIGALLVSALFKGTASIIGFSTPVIALMISASKIISTGVRELSPIFNTDIFPVHVLLSMTAYGLFALSFTSSLMYIFQETWLKHKRIIWLTRWLPSLFILDDLGYKTLTIGMPFFTLGIVTGSLWANRVFGSYWNWDPKETWSLIIWLAYVFVLHARISLGWRGKKFAWSSVMCFLIIVFAFVGVNFLFKGYHNF